MGLVSKQMLCLYKMIPTTAQFETLYSHALTANLICSWSLKMLAFKALQSCKFYALSPVGGQVNY